MQRWMERRPTDDLQPEEVQEVEPEEVSLPRNPEGSQTAVRYHVAKYVLRKVKNVGKPYAGKPHVRFDEEGLVPQPFTLRFANPVPKIESRGKNFANSGMLTGSAQVHRSNTLKSIAQKHSASPTRNTAAARMCIPWPVSGTYLHRFPGYGPFARRPDHACSDLRNGWRFMRTAGGRNNRDQGRDNKTKYCLGGFADGIQPVERASQTAEARHAAGRTPAGGLVGRGSLRHYDRRP